MADPLADALNRINANPQVADPASPNNALKRTLLGSTWLRRAADYVGDSDPAALTEAFSRLNPLTAPGYIAKDISEGKFIENMRMNAGQLARIPTDVAGGLVGLYPFASAVNTMANGAEPWAGAETLGKAAGAIHDFGKDVGETVAGRPLTDDLLRGTGPEMASNWTRQLAGAIIPVPSKIATPVINTLDKFKTGIDAVDKATTIAAKTVEVLTPLAISSKPSATVVGANMAAAGVLGPAAEAGLNAALRPVDQAQEQAKQEMNKGLVEALQGAEQAGVVKPVQAGYSTGDPLVDGGIVAGIVGLGLFSAYRGDLARRVANGVTKAATSYDPAKPADQSVQSFATKFVQDKLNQPEGMTQSLRKTLKAGGVQNADDVVDRFAEETASRRGTSANTRLQSFVNEGKFLDTNIQSIPLNDWAMQYKQLSPQQNTLWQQAMHAEQELDLRTRLIRKSFFDPGPIGSPGARAVLDRVGSVPGVFPQSAYGHNLYNTTTRDLNNIITQAKSDPAIVQVMQGYRDIVDKLSTYTGVEGRFTPREVSQFKRDNPNYVPPNITKGSFLDERDVLKNWDPRSRSNIPRGAETFEELGNPADTLPRYVDEIFRSTEGKKIQRDWFLPMLREAAAGNPYAKKIIGRDVVLDADANNKAVKWRDQFGKLRTTEVNDAVVRDSVRGVTNPTALQLNHGLMSWMSRVYESGAVGPLSLAQGTFFSPKSALYAITAGTAMKRPEGIAMGWLDKGVREATGGKLSMPGDVLGMTADSLYRAAGNVGSVLMDKGAQALHHSVINNGMLTKMIDPAVLKAGADKLADWYRKTAVYDMQQRGLMGPGTYDAVDRTKMYIDPAAQFQRPNVFKTSYNFVNDIMHAISSAPAMSIMAMNKGAEPWKVSSAIRNMVGDPGRSGAFRGSTFQPTAVNSTPWGNIYIQSMHKMAQSMARDPGHFTAAVFNGTVLPVTMATLWNASQGPEYSQYQFFERPADKRASAIYIAAPGRPPNEGWEIDIDPLMRPFKWAGEGLAGMMFGVFSNDIHKGENSDMAGAMKEMVTHGETSFGENTVPNSLLQQVLLPPMPPAIQGVGAAVGVKMRGYGDTRAVPANRQAGYVEGTASDPQHQQLFGATMPSWLEDVVRSVGASGAGAIYHFFTGIDKDVRGSPQQGVEAKSLTDALKYQGKEYKQRVGDSTTELGSGALFGTFRAITPSTEASAAVVKQKMMSIKEINDAFTATMQKGAPKDVLGNRKVGIEPRMGVGPAGPQDLETAQFAADVNSIYKQLQPTLEEIKVAYGQRQGLQNDNRIDPNTKRAQMNEQSYRVVDLNRRMLQDIQRFEAVLSLKYGRPINFDKYNKNVPLSQQ